MKTFDEVFKVEHYPVVIKPSRMPKIIALGFVATITIGLIGKPIDAFVDWREEVAAEKAAEREQLVLEEKRAEEEAERVALAEKRRQGQIASARERKQKSIDDVEQHRVRSLESTYNAWLAETEKMEEGIPKTAATRALAETPIPEKLLVTKLVLPGRDSEDDLAMGRYPVAQKAVAEFRSETMFLNNYMRQLQSRERAISQELQREERERAQNERRAQAEREKQAAADARSQRNARQSSAPAAKPSTPAKSGAVTNW